VIALSLYLSIFLSEGLSSTELWNSELGEGTTEASNSISVVLLERAQELCPSGLLDQVQQRALPASGSHAGLYSKPVLEFLLQMDYCP